MNNPAVIARFDINVISTSEVPEFCRGTFCVSEMQCRRTCLNHGTIQQPLRAVIESLVRTTKLQRR